MTVPRHLFLLAWGLLAYTLVVILWGAFVRISFSGDGCGTHWPLCHGQIIPVGAETKTYVEFAHRVSSAIVGPLVLALLVLVRRHFPKGSQARMAAWGVLFFTITESLVGAKLVLKGLVSDNTSVARAVWLSIHLVNTFLLIAAITLCAWAITQARRQGAPARMEFRQQGVIPWVLGGGLLAMLVLGVSGAITSLGDQLFPQGQTLQIASDLLPTAHFLERLRLLHPFIATSVGLYLVAIATMIARMRPSPRVQRYANVLVGIFVIQLAVGFASILLRAPLPMQLLHLLLADVLWIALLLMGAEALDERCPRQAWSESPSALTGMPIPTASAPTASVPATVTSAVAHALEVHDPHAGVNDTGEPFQTPDPVEPAAPLWKVYVALTKPRVISLLLFTTIAAMFVAKGGFPGWGLLLIVSVGGYMAAGAANAINMVIDQDIDLRMKRTSKRPVVTHRVSSTHALLFGLVLAAGSFGLLSWGANLLSAVLAQCGLLFYVVIYTVLLKRRTWHNIVIGGAAGAFPPLVGYAAVTGNLSPLAWVLFTIIFLWTPVHFWALALLIRDDYAEAGIPMLPVVHGERATVIQIVVYAVLTALISIVPLVQGEARAVYLIGAVLLNALLIVQSVNLLKAPGRPRALSLYKYSMLYLALLFTVIAVDRAGWMG